MIREKFSLNIQIICRCIAFLPIIRLIAKHISLALWMFFIFYVDFSSISLQYRSKCGAIKNLVNGIFLFLSLNKYANLLTTNTCLLGSTLYCDELNRHGVETRKQMKRFEFHVIIFFIAIGMLKISVCTFPRFFNGFDLIEVISFVGD